MTSLKKINLKIQENKKCKKQFDIKKNLRAATRRFEFCQPRQLWSLSLTKLH